MCSQCGMPVVGLVVGEVVTCGDDNCILLYDLLSSGCRGISPTPLPSPLLPSSAYPFSFPPLFFMCVWSERFWSSLKYSLSFSPSLSSFHPSPSCSSKFFACPYPSFPSFFISSPLTSYLPRPLILGYSWE